MLLADLRSSMFVRHALALVTWPVRRRLQRYEGTHEGQSCYIFGDGVSIKNYDLSKFADLPGIAVGVFPRHVDAQKTNLLYWILPEPMFFWPAVRKGPYTSRSARRDFQNFFRPTNMIRTNTIPVVNVTNFPVGLRMGAHYVFDSFPSANRSVFGRRDIDYFAGSINASLSFALFLGFNRVYLVGFDYTHSPPIAGHWYEHGRGSHQNLGLYNRHFLNWIQEYLEVFTVVPGAQDSILPAAVYSELTGVSTTYRENTELLSAKDLKTLALWSDYKIYPPEGP